MTILPTALVSVEIKQIRNIPASLITGTQRTFAHAIIGLRHFGRSSVLPSGATTFDLWREPQPWRYTCAVDNEAVWLLLEIWDDLGCFPNHRLALIHGSIPSPYANGTIIIGSGPEIECEVMTRVVPAPTATAVVPRSPQGAPSQATITVSNTLVVYIANIRGLHKPGFVPSGVTRPKRSEPCPWYRSEDERGRIFLNRDLTGAYASDMQLIELTVYVYVPRGQLPSDAKIKWTVIDPDDPFDADPQVHREWAPYIDAKDYNATGAPTGARGGDNEGSPKRNPPWEEVEGFPLSSLAATSAQTDIVSNESKVILHCPDVAGDTIIVRADIESSTPMQVFEAETGLMTLWHRLEVESIRMKSALALPLDQVPEFFEQACAELNFEQDRVVEDQPFMAADEKALSAASATYVNTNFSHARNPGWFCVISAMEPHRLPSKLGVNVFNGNVTLGTASSGADQFIDIPGRHPTANYAKLTWDSNTVGFSLFSPQELQRNGRWFTRLWILWHDVIPKFTAGDGSLNHAMATSVSFLPQGRREGNTLVAPGYGATRTVDAKVYLPGAFYTDGISPPITVGGVEYFGGRTIVFSHHGAYYNRSTGVAHPDFASRIVSVIVHELVHAFGMPHKCGYFDYKNPRKHTCYMNYSPNWMMDSNQQLIAGSSQRIGSNMCGRHIKEVRRVHLEDNVGLKSLGW